MTKVTHVPLAITQQFDCSYLPDQIEQLIFVQPEQQLTPIFYQHLMSRGFRRSGNDAYRPHCPMCDKCQSLRIKAAEFVPSKSQKRLLNKNKHLKLRMSSSVKPSYYPLYEKYISVRHGGGSMFPPSEEQFASFSECQWADIQFAELYLERQLIAVAIIDRTPDALSAVYTFFDPDHDKLSLGSYSILLQIELAKRSRIKYVYLGYFIDGCASMNYKQKFLPNERFIQDSWIIFKN